MKLYLYHNTIFLLLLLSIVTFGAASSEEMRYICGGNSELKILCYGDIESLYEIPEDLNISITFPTTSDVNNYDINLLVSLQKNPAICNYSLNGGTNISLGSVGYNFNQPVTVVSGNNYIDVWCMDTFNLNNTYHDSVSFYTYVQISGASSGDSSGINLYKIQVEGLAWEWNTINKVKVNVYDIHNNLIEPDSVKMKVLTNVSLISESVSRIGTGVYQGNFKIGEPDVKEVTLEITAKEKEKIVTQSFTVPVNLNDSNSFQNYVINKLDDADNFWKNNKFYVILAGIGVIIMLIWYFIILVTNKRK